jgi:subtilisin family serine protease
VIVDFAGQYNRDRIAPLRVGTPALTGGTSPAVIVTRGHEYQAADIDAALTTPGMPFDSVDRDGHGTHVIGTAGGDGSQSGNCHGSGYYVGVAPDADLIAVKTSFSNADNIRAAQYIFDRATALNRPAVVNFSLGGEIGAHDGTDADEVALDGMLTGTQGRAIVVSAGNDGARYDHAHPEREPARGGGLHAHKTVPANGTVTLQFVIGPGDRTDDSFDLWYDGAGRLDVQVTAPGGATLPAPVSPGAPVVTGPLAGHTLFLRSRTGRPQNGRHQIFLQISPSATSGIVAPGTWTLTLTETAGTATDIDCWFDLDKRDPHPRFINADQDRTRTITTPGTARNVITVGSYDPATSVLADSSSRGPTTDGRRKPEICAPGVGITAALTGVSRERPCSDCCTDFYVPKSGTSMAAPHVTGIVALLFQRNRTLTFDQVRAHLVASCRPPDPITAPTLPNNDWGAGKVDAEVAAAGVPAVAQGGEVLDGAPVLPVPAYPDVYLPARVRMKDLERRLRTSATGELAAYLLSRHLDEVLRLVRTNRRVAVAWHRAYGPVLVRVLLRGGADEGHLPRALGGALLPAAIDGHPVAAGLERFLDELARSGSARLQDDVERYRDFALALPGARLDDLDRLRQVG